MNAMRRSRAGYPASGAGASVSLQDLASRVVAAVRADRVEPARMPALRGWLKLHQRQRQVRPAAALASLGEFDLGESHGRCGSLPEVGLGEPGGEPSLGSEGEASIGRGKPRAYRAWAGWSTSSPSPRAGAALHWSAP